MDGNLAKPSQQAGRCESKRERKLPSIPLVVCGASDVKLRVVEGVSLFESRSHTHTYTQRLMVELGRD